MKKIILMLVVVGFLGVLTVDSFAQRTPRGHKRMERQGNRIKQGVNSGSLTRRETQRLVNQRKEIKSSVKTAKSDGKLTVRERRNLRGQLNRSSRSIYRMKHNNRTRGKR